MLGEEEKKQDLSDVWTHMPDTFAHVASRGKWTPYPYLKYVSDRITDKLIRGGGRFIITMPPRHGKSEFISKWVPTWFLYNFPERKIILASYSAEFAGSWGSKVKDNLSQNSLIAAKMSGDTRAKRRFATSEGGQMITAGVGGSITGEGAHLFIIDDPIKNWQEATSELIRERHKTWFKSVAKTRLEPGASMIVMHTRWHEDDLIGWLTAKENKDDELVEPWEVINFPAIAEEDEPHIGRKIGDALCPTRYSIETLTQIKNEDKGGMVWQALYQQRPSPLGGNMVQREWIKFYDIGPAFYDEKAIFADLTYKEGTENDFAVVECWGRKGPDIFLIDQIRGRMGFTDQMNAIRLMSQRHPDAFAKEIEEYANGAAVIEMLKTEITGIIPVKPQTSKMARLAAVTPVYQAGNVHYPNPKMCPWVEANIHEMLMFPNARNDDTVDVATMAVNRLGRVSSSIARLEAMGRW